MYEERKPRQLFKSPDNRVIDGVCGGLGEYFGIDPVLVRIGFLAGLFFGGGATFPLYIILMFAMPQHPEHKRIKQQRRQQKRGKYVTIPSEEDEAEKQKRKNEEIHVAKPIRDYDEFRDKVKRNGDDAKNS